MDGPLFELLHNCTVRLKAPGGYGTGFFVAPGLILTCAHVIEGAGDDETRIMAYYEGEGYQVREIVKFLPKPYPDLALLRIDLRDHPCVYLDESVKPRDQLYTYSYTEAHLAGESTTLDSEGSMRTDDGELLLKLKMGQVLPGSSGSPLLNTHTWGVCGVVKSTRDRTTELGGGAIPTEVVLSQMPELVALQEAFHRQDARWVEASDRQIAPQRKLDAILYEKTGVIPMPDRLFGRDDLLVEVGALLDASEQVLLHGLAGTGKTALAATIADQRIRDGKGPVSWLQPAHEDADAIFDAFVRRFATEEEKQEINPLAGDAKAVAVKDLLARSEATLLVLDDVWNGPALKQVLKAVPNGMPVLVTSRQRFGLGKIVDVGDLPLDEALSLLGYHAGEKDYSADEGAHRLCEELGHHPYALEIAGTTLKVDALTPEELCEEIANAPHDMPMPEEFAKEGRQSVKELLDGSFDALDAETQAVFWAFGALFAPGATSALLAVYMKREKRAVREALRKLVRRSLAKRLKGIDYYYVHELTFSYAETMVFGLEVPDRQPTVAAVQRYVIGHAQDFDNLQLDLSNILQAAKAADDQALVPIMSALTVGGYPEMQSPSFFDVRGHTLDLLVCLDKAIEVAGQMRVGQNELRHYLLSKRGNAHFDRGRLEEAFGVYQAALELAPNPNRKVILLAVMGKVRAKQGRYDEANDYFGQGYELAEANQDERALAFVLELQSVAAGGKGDFGAARRFAAQAVEVNRRLEGQDSARLGYSLLNLGSAEGDLGIQKALSIHQKAYEIARDEGDLDLMASVLYALGCDYHALYKYGEAQKHLDEARKLFLQIGCTAEETEVAVFMRQFGYSAM